MLFLIVLISRYIVTSSESRRSESSPAKLGFSGFLLVMTVKFKD